MEFQPWQVQSTRGTTLTIILAIVTIPTTVINSTNTNGYDDVRQHIHGHHPNQNHNKVHTC